MKTLGTKGIKYLKIAHLFFVIVWFGGGIALSVSAIASIAQSNDAIYMRSLILQIIDDYLIIPGAIGCLLTGLIYGIWSKWGFFKHRWLTVKWILTAFSILFGTFILGPWINNNVDLSKNINDIATSEIAHNLSMTQIWGTLQLSMLLIMVIISVLKPWKKK